MKGFIIDDEAAPRLILRHLLKEIEPQIEILGEANNLEEGMAALKHLSIDVLFLDIEMPRHKGLDIHQFLDAPLDFEIIFVTAFSEYAIRAFKLSAFDYLLKPVKPEDLESSIHRLKEKRNQLQKQLLGLDVLRNNLSKKDTQQYLLRTHREELVIEVNDIINLEADGMYTDIVLTNERITASKPMKEILSDLPDFFFRSHRSFAINLNNVELPVRITNEGVRMKTGTAVALSNRKKQAFIEQMKSF